MPRGRLTSASRTPRPAACPCGGWARPAAAGSRGSSRRTGRSEAGQCQQLHHNPHHEDPHLLDLGGLVSGDQQLVAVMALPGRGLRPLHPVHLVIGIIIIIIIIISISASSPSSPRSRPRSRAALSASAWTRCGPRPPTSCCTASGLAWVITTLVSTEAPLPPPHLSRPRGSCCGAARR